MSKPQIRKEDYKEALEYMFVSQLKKEIARLNGVIKDKDKVILNFERDARITTLQEHKVHISTLEEECKRLRKRTGKAIKFAREVDYEHMQQ